MALLVLCRVGFPYHRPHWLQASEQAFQKAPSARLQPEAVGLVAHGSALGSTLLKLQHTVGEVGGLVAQGGAVAVGAAAAPDGVDGEHITEDTLGRGEFGVWGARRHLRIRSAEGRIREWGAEPGEGGGRGMLLMDTSHGGRGGRRGEGGPRVTHPSGKWPSPLTPEYRCSSTHLERGITKQAIRFEKDLTYYLLLTRKGKYNRVLEMCIMED